MTPSQSPPAEVERSCALAAVALSDRRREGARLISGAHRAFGLNAARTVVHVPYPAPAAGWTRRTLTCGVALQCAPSKDRIASVDLGLLTARERGALSVVEGAVALGWITELWPGLVPELARMLPGLSPDEADLDVEQIMDRALALARARAPLTVDPLLGRLPSVHAATGGVTGLARRMYGRMPWTSRRKHPARGYTVPVGGDGGIRNPNLPPPSCPENEDIEIRPDERAGIPYPEWNFWREEFLVDHVAVLERRVPAQAHRRAGAEPDVRRWFQQQTHRSMRGGLDDGSDLDVDRYVSHFLDARTGPTPEPRIFRDLLPTSRDVTTAVLLDGSSSLGVHQGRIFRLELACADALSRAMAAARERHGIFVFTGNTRHHVDVRCLKDFDDAHFVAPGSLGLATAGYTRLGAPIRHVTSRLLEQPSQRRLLLLIGDGLISDEGYEGRYAWADVAHAVEEADEAGVSIYYLGVGPTRVDPLPEVFGPRRSQRIRQIEELPRVLAHVHRELVAV